MDRRPLGSNSSEPTLPLGYAPTMFCQSCGKENAEDARFCNMCGRSIAEPGSPGGPIVPDGTQLGVGPSTMEEVSARRPVVSIKGAGGGAPGRPNMYGAMPEHGGPSMLSVSLAAIGVQSKGRAWATVLGIAFTLMAIGALATWLVMRGSGDEVASAAGGRAAPEDPFVIGTPLPAGEEAPEVDYVSGAPGDPASTRATSMAGGAASAMEPVERPSPGGSSGTGAPRPPTTMDPSPPTAMTSSSMESSGATSMTSGAQTGGGETSTTAGTETTGTEMTGGGTTAPPVDTVPDDMEAPEERDLEMELYSSRVQFVIRRYYGARAQTCFDRATRNNPTLNGTVVVGLTVGPDGMVTASNVVRNTTGDDALGGCLASQVRQWRFPVPPGGQSLQMNMPFSR